MCSVAFARVRLQPLVEGQLWILAGIAGRAAGAASVAAHRTTLPVRWAVSSRLKRGFWARSAPSRLRFSRVTTRLKQGREREAKRWPSPVGKEIKSFARHDERGTTNRHAVSASQPRISAFEYPSFCPIRTNPLMPTLGVLVWAEEQQQQKKKNK